MIISRESQGGPISVPMPFLGRAVGAGDSITRLALAAGAKPCGGCKRRAQTLNRLLVFRPWGSK
jgi:hypothetical protein